LGELPLPHELKTFQALEESLHQTATRGSPDKVRALLADGFVEFGSSGGVYGKEETIAALAGEGAAEGPPASISAYDFALRTIAPDTVLLTYRSKRLSGDGHERHALRSSLWQFIDGRWQMIFHQGTVIPAE
jgi:hypothetical protein